MKPILLVLLFIALKSCVNGISIDNRDLQRYSEICDLYPKEFVNHLPGLMDGKVKRMEFKYPRGNYLNYIHLIMSFSKEQIDSIKQYAKTNAIRCYSFNDSCLYMVDHDPQLYQGAIVLHHCKDFESLLPVSNFSFCVGPHLPHNFYKEAVIYLLSAKSGKFLCDNSLSMDGVGLSENWRHGYTKGMAISGRTVAYWLEVW